MEATSTFPPLAEPNFAPIQVYANRMSPISRTVADLFCCRFSSCYVVLSHSASLPREIHWEAMQTNYSPQKLPAKKQHQHPRQRNREVSFQYNAGAAQQSPAQRVFCGGEGTHIQETLVHAQFKHIYSEVTAKVPSSESSPWCWPLLSCSPISLRSFLEQIDSC